MIKLTYILKEAIDISRKRYSWLTPYGTFLPIKYSHGSDAVKFTGDVKDPIMTAWQKGYFRITFMGSILIAHNEVMVPNDKQKASLINLAVETDAEKIEYDGGENQSIIWSIHDTL